MAPLLVPMLFALPHAVFGQFGGGQFGGGGGLGGYSPPAPICPAFSCGKGQKAVGKPATSIVSYGCKDAGMNILSTSDFDPSNPLGGMNRGGKNLNKCCVERDICKQTCGMSSKECHDTFQKCQLKICKGDQNCQLQAMISDMSNDPFDQHTYDPLDKGSKYDPEETKCRGYKNAQAEVCQCVPKDDIVGANTIKLKHFYAKHNPEKLDSNGEIKDVEDVWKKWKGKEASMFVALATKYKEKVLTMKQKPKPPPYTPPSKDDDSQDDTVASDPPEDEPRATPPPAPAVEESDPESEAFEKQFKELVAKKDKAKKEEDFDAAIDAKDAATALKSKEIDRLKAKKDDAVQAEDYTLAKHLKARISKLEL